MCKTDRKMETDQETGTRGDGHSENRRETVAGESRPVGGQGGGLPLHGTPSCPCLLPLPPSPGRSRERYPSKAGSFLTLLLALQGAVRLVTSSAASPPVRPSPTPTSPSAFPRFAGPARWQRDCAGRARQDRTRPVRPLRMLGADGAGCPQRGRRARGPGERGPGTQPACSSWDRRQLQLTLLWRVRENCEPLLVLNTPPRPLYQPCQNERT